MARRRRVAAHAPGTLAMGNTKDNGTRRHSSAAGSDPSTTGFTPAQVASHLQVSADGLERLCRRFGRYLSRDAAAPNATFSHADVAMLATVQRLLNQGYDDAQIDHSLTPPRVVATETAPDIPTALAATRVTGQDDDGEDSSDANAGEPAAGLARLVGDAMNTLAGTQQAVLNNQSSLREMLNVVVQDNFNLKDENRKLRDRMLELERALAEYQRREETRKERSEGRLRALEATVAALQQQIAQLVQLQRQQQRRRGWFG
jgi:flagellar capping protein FliD